MVWGSRKRAALTASIVFIECLWTDDGGNGAAAKQLRFQNAGHRRLPFTALFCHVCRSNHEPRNVDSEGNDKNGNVGGLPATKFQFAAAFGTKVLADDSLSINLHE